MKPPETAKEVTREEFHQKVLTRDVHPTPEGQYPYLSTFKTPAGFVAGWIQNGDHTKESRYFLP